MLCSSRARVYKNGIVVWEILLLVFYLFLQKQEVLSVGFKQSWVKKKKKEISKLLRSSLLSSKPSSFDSAEREREVTDSLLLVLVSVFLRLFL